LSALIDAIAVPEQMATVERSYCNVVIRDEKGALRDFATVHALLELSGLVRPDASAAFIFLKGPNGWRLCFVYSDDGASGRF
jgi:hypothetical protein